MARRLKLTGCVVAILALSSVPALALVSAGTGAADRLVGGDRSDVLAGGFANDDIQGLGGNDELYGDSGSDRKSS
jgi:Ca2+-binding RTX toxin-like protein